MANRRYTPFNFGFLNTAQDPADLKDFESPDAKNLDPDKLALGSLSHKQYTGEGSIKDFTETSLGSRRFFLGDASDADRVYTEYSTGDGYATSNTYVQLPLTTSGGVESHVIAFDFHMVNSPSGSSEKILGTAVATVFDHLFKVTLESGDLVFTFSDGVTTQTITLIYGVTEGTWHQVVIVHNPEVDKGYAAYVDGVLVGEQVGSTLVQGEASPFYIGSHTDPSFVFRIRNVLIARGNATSPASYDGSIRTLGFEDEIYNFIIASRDGSGADNRQQLSLTKSDSPVSSGVVPSVAEGKLMYEVGGSDGGVSDFPAYTQFEYSNSSDMAERCDRDMPFGDAVFMGMAVRVENASVWLQNVSRVLFTFEDSAAAGTPVGVKISAYSTITNPYYELRVSIEDASGFNEETVISRFTPGDTTYVSVVIYDASTESITRYVANWYVNGRKVFTQENDTDDWTIRNSTIRPIFMSTDDTLASAGGYFLTTSYRDIVIGNIRSSANYAQLASWVGQDKVIERNVDVLLSSANGSLSSNDQGFSTSLPIGFILPEIKTPANITGLPVVVELVAEDDGPIKPQGVTGDVVNGLVIDDGSGVLPTGWTLQEIPGQSYNGPEEYKVSIKNLTSTTGVGTRSTVEASIQNGGYHLRAGAIEAIPMGNNLELSIDRDVLALPFSDAGPYTLTIKSPALLDGEYKYRAVGIRYSDTEPRVEIESIASDPVDIKVKNIGHDGRRVANNVPEITVPAASPGFPDFVDRVDLYRRDPDIEDYVKIAEHSGVSGYVFQDNTIITTLPKITFLSTGGDETFDSINDSMGNDSATYYILFNKDNRLWTVPTDRKDLMFYSRQDDWWGWTRDNSFSFNGDIVDVVTLRDINVVSGESTLVVFTTKGIYHVSGSGTPENPYTRVPMFGADGNSEINMYAGSALPFNGSIFLLAKSSDGGYDTGAYGQKAYEYNLQQLVEISGRIREQSTLSDTAELEYASLIGGDKYIIKRESNGACLVYHKDARGWLTYDDGEDADWTWKSKTYDRVSGEQGTFFDSSMFKLEYKGDISLSFWMKPYGQDDFIEKAVPTLSSVSKTIKQNMLPTNMGEQWYFTVSGTASSEVYNMWFVS